MKTHHLFEARDPDVTYTDKKKKGLIDRVIATLEGDKSGAFTRLANRYRRLKRVTDLLEREKARLNEDVTDRCEGLFDAQDEIYTRVVETVSLTVTLSKKQSVTDETFDIEGYVEELETLLPQFGELFENLRAKYTSIDTYEKKAALRVKVKDDPKVTAAPSSGSKRGTRRVYESETSNHLDMIEKFADKSEEVINLKLKPLDKEIDALRKQMKAGGIL